MANQQHLALLKGGVDSWNQWRKDHDAIAWVDLSAISLRGANLAGANLRGANLSRNDLREVNLAQADLTNAILSDAEITNANLSGTLLRNANLWGANLWNSDLSGANLVGAELWRANLTNTNLSQANLQESDLTTARLVETNLKQANLAGARVYGIAAWNVNLEGAVQTNLIITRPFEPSVVVDDIEVAQFVYLLLNHRKLRNLFNAVTERGVLILGRFGGGGIEILHSIATQLRKMEYLPIIFDFERPTNRDYTETVKTLTGLSRFVIIDLSGPSVPQELYATIPFFDIPFVPIIESGREIYSMFRDLQKYPWVLSPAVEFQNKDHLLEIMPSEIIAAAEKYHKKRQGLLEELFPRIEKK